MRTRILLLVMLALGGLAAVVSVAGWNLRAISAAVREQREVASALADLGGEAQARTQALRLHVDDLFEVTSTTDLATRREALEAELAGLAQVVTRLTDARFAAALAAPAGDGRTLAEVAAAAAGGGQALVEASRVAGELAAGKLALRERLAPAKEALSKAFRACLDLQALDPKAFNLLARGVITTMSTDSGRDVKFAGNAKFEEGRDLIRRRTDLSEAHNKALTTLEAAYATAYGGDKGLKLGVVE
jgi:hypothetical protein